MLLEPLETTEWVAIEKWCRNYNRHNKYPTNILERFAIGIYQIHQGMEWANTTPHCENALNKAESYMAALLHFTMVGEAMGLSIHRVRQRVDGYETWPLPCARVLFLVSKAQQQLFYQSRMTKTQRGSRFNKDLTAELLHELQIKMLSAVPSDLRQVGMFHASRIMIGKL